LHLLLQYNIIPTTLLVSR